MTKIERYRQMLIGLVNWEPFLLAESGLPGPRGNIELAQAVADLGSEAQFEHFLTFTADVAPVNSPYEFLAFCGVVGLGRLAAEGRLDTIPRLREYACDRRWRMREGVAMALQRFGDANMPLLLDEMEKWIDGNPLRMRAAAAAIAEPRLLMERENAQRALNIMDLITRQVLNIHDRRSSEFRILRQGLAYTWSVVVAALPEVGIPILERWLDHDDPDVAWIMRENLKKKRLARLISENGEDGKSRQIIDL